MLIQESERIRDLQLIVVSKPNDFLRSQTVTCAVGPYSGNNSDTRAVQDRRRYYIPQIESDTWPSNCAIFR